jgi:hypothetical protein
MKKKNVKKFIALKPSEKKKMIILLHEHPEIVSQIKLNNPDLFKAMVAAAQTQILPLTYITPTIPVNPNPGLIF